MQWLQGDMEDIKKEKAVANNGVAIPQHSRVTGISEKEMSSK